MCVAVVIAVVRIDDELWSTDRRRCSEKMYVIFISLTGFYRCHIQRDKNEMAGNLRALESRIDNIRSQLDVRATSGGALRSSEHFFQIFV